MAEEPITFVIDGRTYRVRGGDSTAIRAIPAEDRRRLIGLLEAVKAQDRLAESAIREVVEGARSNRQSGAVATPTMETPVSGAAGAGRLGSGDIDNLVARLAMEERQNRKAMPSRSGVYKWAVGLAAMVFLLTVIL
jgi:hypothetical protein